MSTPTSNEAEEDTVPAIFQHCQMVFDAMMQCATRAHSEGIDMLVYEGHLTKLFRDLHLSVPYYSSVTRELKRMGCIRQLRRGGGNAPSQWELITAPTEARFKSNRTHTVTPRDARIAALEQQMRMVLQRLTDLENAGHGSAA